MRLMRLGSNKGDNRTSSKQRKQKLSSSTTNNNDADGGWAGIMMDNNDTSTDGFHHNSFSQNDVIVVDNNEKHNSNSGFMDDTTMELSQDQFDSPFSPHLPSSAHNDHSNNSLFNNNNNTTSSTHGFSNDQGFDAFSDFDMNLNDVTPSFTTTNDNGDDGGNADENDGFFSSSPFPAISTTTTTTYTKENNDNATAIHTAFYNDPTSIEYSTNNINTSYNYKDDDDRQQLDSHMNEISRDSHYNEISRRDKSKSKSSKKNKVKKSKTRGRKQSTKTTIEEPPPQSQPQPQSLPHNALLMDESTTPLSLTGTTLGTHNHPNNNNKKNKKKGRTNKKKKHHPKVLQLSGENNGGGTTIMTKSSSGGLKKAFSSPLALFRRGSRNKKKNKYSSSSSTNGMRYDPDNTSTNAIDGMNGGCGGVVTTTGGQQRQRRDRSTSPSLSKYRRRGRRRNNREDSTNGNNILPPGYGAMTSDGEEYDPPQQDEQPQQQQQQQQQQQLGGDYVTTASNYLTGSTRSNSHFSPCPAPSPARESHGASYSWFPKADDQINDSAVCEPIDNDVTNSNSIQHKRQQQQPQQQQHPFSTTNNIDTTATSVYSSNSSTNANTPTAYSSSTLNSSLCLSKNQNTPIDVDTLKRWTPLTEIQLLERDEDTSMSDDSAFRLGEEEDGEPGSGSEEYSLGKVICRTLPSPLLVPKKQRQGMLTDDDDDDGDGGGCNDIVNETETSSVGVDREYCLEKSECPHPAAVSRLVHHGLHRAGGSAFCNDLDGDVGGGVSSIEGKFISNAVEGDSNEDDDNDEISIGKLLVSHNGDSTTTGGGAGETGPNIDRPPLGSSSKKKPINNNPEENYDNSDDQTDNHTTAGGGSTVTTTSQTSKLTLGILAQISGLVDFDDDVENQQQYGTTYRPEEDDNGSVDGDDEVERAAQINSGRDSISVPMDHHLASHDLSIVVDNSPSKPTDNVIGTPSSALLSPFTTNLSAIQNQSTHHIIDDSPSPTKEVIYDHTSVAPTSLTGAFNDADVVSKITSSAQQRGRDEASIDWKSQTTKTNLENLTNYILETKTTNSTQETKTETTVPISMSSSSDNSIDIVKDDGGSHVIQEQLHHVYPTVVTNQEDDEEFSVRDIKNRWKQRDDGFFRSSSQQPSNNKAHTIKAGNNRNTNQLIELEWPSHGPLSPTKSKGVEKKEEVNFEDDFFASNDEDEDDSHDKWNPRSVGSGKLIEPALSFHDMNSSFGGSSTGNYIGDGFVSAVSGFSKPEKKRDSTTPPPGPFWRSHPRKSTTSSIESKARQRSSKTDLRQTRTPAIDVIDELPINVHFPLSQEEYKNCTAKLTKFPKVLDFNSKWPINSSSNEDIPNTLAASSQVSPRTHSFKKDFSKTTSRASSNIQNEVKKPRSFVKEKHRIQSSPTPSTHMGFRNQDLSGESSRSSYHSYGSRQSSKKPKEKQIIQNMPAMVTPEVSIRREFEEDARSGYSRPSSVNDRMTSLRGLLKNDAEEDTRSVTSKSSRASSFAGRIAAFETRSASGAVTPYLPRTHLTLATPNTRPPLSNTALQDASKEGGLW